MQFYAALSSEVQQEVYAEINRFYDRLDRLGEVKE